MKMPHRYGKLVLLSTFYYYTAQKMDILKLFFSILFTEFCTIQLVIWLAQLAH